MVGGPGGGGGGGGSSAQVTLLGFRGVMKAIKKLSSDSHFHEFEFLSVFYSQLEA